MTDEQIERLLEHVADEMDRAKMDILELIRISLTVGRMDPEKLMEDARDIMQEIRSGQKEE